MKRWFAALCLVLCALPAWAQDPPALISVVPNKDFIVYSTPKASNATPDKIEMVYFYWYGSPASKQIDRELRNWAKTRPYGLRLSTSPVIFDNANHQVFGTRVFYALQLLGKDEEISPLLLEAVTSNRVDFNNIPAVIKWMGERGIAEKDFLKALDDPKTKASTIRTRNMMNYYDIQSTPTVVINGKYMVRVTDKVNPQRFLQIVKFLADRLAENRNKP